MALQKQCKKCELNKDLEEFTINRALSDGLSLYCKDCDGLMRKRLRDKDPDEYRSRHFQSRYGITLERYNEMFAEQNGCCYICLKHQDDLPKRLCIDHSHTTKAVRKLLCDPCNKALGLIKENPDTALAMAQYARDFGDGVN